MIFTDIAAEWLAEKLLDRGLSFILVTSETRMAFERAVSSFRIEYPHLVTDRALESTDRRANRSVLAGRTRVANPRELFPQLDELTNLIETEWLRAKARVAPQLRPPLLALDDDAAEPVLRRFAELMFVQLSQLGATSSMVTAQSLHEIAEAVTAGRATPQQEALYGLLNSLEDPLVELTRFLREAHHLRRSGTSPADPSGSSTRLDDAGKKFADAIATFEKKSYRAQRCLSGAAADAVADAREAVGRLATLENEVRAGCSKQELMCSQEFVDARGALDRLAAALTGTLTGPAIRDWRDPP